VFEVASDLDGGFDTLAFVPLAAVGDPELVVATIARAVGLQSTARRPLPPWPRTFDHGRRGSSSTIMAKLRLRSRTRIAVWAVQHGLSPSRPD
jgi:hypothetical protein